MMLGKCSGVELSSLTNALMQTLTTVLCWLVSPLTSGLSEIPGEKVGEIVDISTLKWERIHVVLEVMLVNLHFDK